MPQLIATIDGVEIKRVHLQKDRTTLGRKQHNDIVLSDMVVSGDHCVFEMEGLADVYLQDVGSTNGTYLNGKMVHGEKVRLRDHDVVGIGRFRIQFLSASKAMDFGRTDTMSLDALSHPGAANARHASLKVLSGSSAGLEVPVVKAVTTFGKPGVIVVAISHRLHGFYVAVVEGDMQPTLNGEPIGTDARPLADQDVLDLAGTRLQFLLKE